MRGRKCAAFLALGMAGGVCVGCGAAPPPAAEALWVALVRGDGTLTPIAREQDGTWDRPWPSPFRDILRIDSAGVLRPLLGVRWESGHEPWALPVEVSDSGLVRLTTPLEWHHYNGTEAVGSMAAMELRLAPAQCFRKWVLDTDRRVPAWERQDAHEMLSGVAFSSRVEVVAEEDVPGLDGIREQLGYIDGTGSKVTRFVWLGFYRLGDGGTVIGVMSAVGYEGERVDVVEIEDGVGTVVVQASGGGC